MKQFLQKSTVKTTDGKTVCGIVTSLNDHAYVILWVTECDTKKNLNATWTFELCPSKEKELSESKTQLKNEIQCCCITIEKSEKGVKCFCGVSRFDKSLSIYDFSNEIDMSCDEKSKVKNIHPYLIHVTERKVIALEFFNFNKNEEPFAIAAADLQGDVTAYPLDNNMKKKRLLLGHTTSILTGIKIYNGFIYTSDRDRKVRVSFFPNTFEIDGYLLGHSDYISSFDICDNKCVTCSGDGSIRLWDCNTYEQVSLFDFSKDGSTNILSNVCMNPNGQLVAVVRLLGKEEPSDDSSSSIEILEESSMTMTNLQSISCPVTPLGLTFTSNTSLIVLALEPYYFLHYQLSKDEGILQVENISSISVPCQIISHLGNTSSIKMPRSNLLWSHLEGDTHCNQFWDNSGIQMKIERDVKKKKYNK